MPQYTSEKTLPENEWLISAVRKDKVLMVYYQVLDEHGYQDEVQNFAFLIALRQLIKNPKYFISILKK